jgi:filamentous hemagglutinin
MPYEAGSWQDKLIEAFGGSHDVIGGQVTGLYDEQGNIRRGMTDTERKVYDNLVTTTALVPATPFAAATLLPAEVWKAISILLKGAK